MKGLYILISIITAFLVLGFFVFKSTDADLRRTYEQIVDGVDKLEEILVSLEIPMTEIRREKAKTFKIDQQYDFLRTKVRTLRTQLNVALHNLENFKEKLRKATEESLAGLREEVNSVMFSLITFQKMIEGMHEFVQEGFPLLEKLQTLQVQMNQKIDLIKVKTGEPLSEELLQDVESFNRNCKDLQTMARSGMKDLHNKLEYGLTQTRSVVNELKTLLPSFEAFVKDLDKQIPKEK